MKRIILIALTLGILGGGSAIVAGQVADDSSDPPARVAPAPGVDISGPCDEAENVNDARCQPGGEDFNHDDRGDNSGPGNADDDDDRVDNSGPGSQNSGPGSTGSGHDDDESDDDSSGPGSGDDDNSSGHGGGDSSGPGSGHDD
jgi:hypothetical protein